MEVKEMAAPFVGPESSAFWNAAKEGKFLLKNCSDCGQKHWYPRSACPFCWSDRTRWVQSDGRGVVYSFTVMRRARVPYVLAYVTLEDGPTVMTNIVNVEVNEVNVGMPVQVTFVKAANDTAVPAFEPVAVARISGS